MSSRAPLLIAIAAVLILSAIFMHYYKADKPKYNWSENSWGKKDGYSEKNVEPYGTHIAHEFLRNYLPGRKLVDLKKNVAEELPADTTGRGDNYVFIGEAMYLDSLSTDRLLKFVAAGNTAFISSKTIPFDLMNYIYFEECEDAPWSDYAMDGDSVARLSLRTPSLPDTAYEYYFAVQNRRHSYQYHYIPEEIFCDSLRHYPLGYLGGDEVNFAEFPHGKGRFLLHTTPLVFTNFSLLRTETRPYAEGVWSHLSDGNIYWDAMSRIPESVGRRRNGSWMGDRGRSEEHPLTFILQQKSLAWAWYLLAGTAGLWLLFRAKRRQRIIPVLKPNENSSYEFISTIAHLHFREKNYQTLSEQGMKLFLAQIRERYGLTAHVDAGGLPHTDDQFFKNLSLRSEIPEAEARNIFEQYKAVVHYQPTEQMMVDLYLSMEAFLKRAK